MLFVGRCQPMFCQLCVKVVVKPMRASNSHRLSASLILISLAGARCTFDKERAFFSSAAAGTYVYQCGHSWA